MILSNLKAFWVCFPPSLFVILVEPVNNERSHLLDGTFCTVHLHDRLPMPTFNFVCKQRPNTDGYSYVGSHVLFLNLNYSSNLILIIEGVLGFWGFGVLPFSLVW